MKNNRKPKLIGGKWGDPLKIPGLPTTINIEWKSGYENVPSDDCSGSLFFLILQDKKTKSLRVSMGSFLPMGALSTWRGATGGEIFVYGSDDDNEFAVAWAEAAFDLTNKVNKEGDR